MPSRRHIAAAVTPLLESLEARALFSVAADVVVTGDTAVTEGAPAAFTAVGGPGLTCAWVARKGNRVVATGNGDTFAFTPSVHGDYGVQLLAIDADGHGSVAYAPLAVANVAPTNVAIAGDRTGLTEGDAVHLLASAEDAAGDDVSFAWQVTDDGGYVLAAGVGRDIDFVAARGPSRVTVTATDTAGATTTAGTNLDAANAAPTAALAGPTEAVIVNGNAVFSLMFGDASAGASLRVEWDFGDGTVARNRFAGGGNVVKKHAYAEAGTYTVTAAVSDGVSETVVTHTVTVSHAATITDPIDPARTALLVVGTDADDTIVVTQQPDGRYGVTLNNADLGTAFAPTGRVYVYGNGGGNTITVTGDADAVVYAGDGDASNGTDDAAGSTVTTDAGDDIVIGTSGIDRLNGGSGRDVLVGMAGRDVLCGGDGDDALIAGSLARTDTAALARVAVAWAGGDTANLFNRRTLIADDGGNRLYGDGDDDWFVLGHADRASDLQATDSVN